MGLKLNKTIKGITCEYWIITRVVTKKGIDKTFVTLNLYYNQSARNSSIDNWVHFQVFEFEGLDFTRTQLYDKIKLEDGFTGAVDC